MHALFIALGGAAGAVVRYGLGSWVQGSSDRFPWGTFTVNVLGCFLVGCAIRYLHVTSASTELRAFVTVGLLGGFTTFSTYSYETVILLRDGAWLRAGAFSIGSLGLGLLAVVLGLAVTGAWAGSGPGG